MEDKVNRYLDKLAKEYDKGHAAAATGLGAAGGYAGFHVGARAGAATGLTGSVLKGAVNMAKHPDASKAQAFAKIRGAGNAIRSAVKGGKIGAAVGVGAGIYAGKKLADKIYEKKAALDKQSGVAGVASRIISAGKSAGKAIINDAKALPDQARNVGTAFKANGGGKEGLTNPGTVSAAKGLLKNKALLTGAGVVGAGVVASSGGKRNND